MIIKNEFPQSFYVKIDGLYPDYEGRIEVYQDGNSYNIEIDIVQNESGKIYTHVKSLYGIADVRDGVDFSMDLLNKFLQSK